MTGERNVYASSSDGDDDEERKGNEWSVTSEVATLFDPRTMYKVSLSSSCSLQRRGKRSTVKKTTAVLKSMTDKKDKRNSREWYASSKTRWLQPAGSSAGQSSVDTWEHVTPRGKVDWGHWRLQSTRRTREGEESRMGKKRQRWCKKRSRTVRYAWKAATDEKKEERDRIKLGDKLQAFLNLTGLMEEKMENVVAAQQKSFETEQSLCNALREYVDEHDRDQDRVKTLMTKCWQSIQSRDTKNLNLEKGLEDMHSTARKVGWCEEEKTTKLWKQIEGDEQWTPPPCFSAQDGMHSVLGSRMDLPHGDESVTKCLHDFVHEIARKGIWWVPVRSGQSDVERNVRRMAAIPEGKTRKPSRVIKAWANDAIQHRGKSLGCIRNLKKVLRLRLQDEETNTPERSFPAGEVPVHVRKLMKFPSRVPDGFLIVPGPKKIREIWKSCLKIPYQGESCSSFHPCDPEISVMVRFKYHDELRVKNYGISRKSCDFVCRMERQTHRRNLPRVTGAGAAPEHVEKTNEDSQLRIWRLPYSEKARAPPGNLEFCRKIPDEGEACGSSTWKLVQDIGPLRNPRRSVGAREEWVTNSCNSVWKSVSRSPSLKKESCKRNEENAGWATAWGGAKQGGVCQSWKCDLLWEQDFERTWSQAIVVSAS